MNIYDALSKITWRKREYFKWKHHIRYDQRLPKKSEEEFLRFVSKKTMNSFLQWEKTSEYRQLLALYLDSRIANDLDDIYKSVSEKAKEGDPQAVKLYLQLQKEISSHAKQALKVFDNEEQEEEEDDLEIV
ncbi:hypothetical protein BTR22_05280 [Alkalihalophilus pseudofirmus]|uniref:hypothetical protein n=1 Tax=Alkalihalophilus pseudofirmus TaxID=79885 RepID=UPI0009530D11|nr:hypothetical protein BTR22_05280 [Alkalihalophilus pseudofirmus]